jgi:hypothetical protein
MKRRQILEIAGRMFRTTGRSRITGAVAAKSARIVKVVAGAIDH